MSKRKTICPVCKAKITDTINVQVSHGMKHRSVGGERFPPIFGGKPLPPQSSKQDNE